MTSHKLRVQILSPQIYSHLFLKIDSKAHNFREQQRTNAQIHQLRNRWHCGTIETAIPLIAVTSLTEGVVLEETVPIRPLPTENS